MATSTVSPTLVPFPQALPAVRKAPKTIQDALLRGWAVVKDKPAKQPRPAHVEGTVILQKPNCPTLLSVSYVGTLEGYTFGAPQIVTE